MRLMNKSNEWFLGNFVSDGAVSCATGVIVYRGCYFGFFDTLKPIILTVNMADTL